MLSYAMVIHLGSTSTNGKVTPPVYTSWGLANSANLNTGSKKNLLWSSPKAWWQSSFHSWDSYVFNKLRMILVEVILSILESPCQELHIAHGLTLVHPSLSVWKAFPTPSGLAHTRITWALSPTAPQVSGVTPGSPLCPWCFWHSSWRCARHLGWGL